MATNWKHDISPVDRTEETVQESKNKRNVSVAGKNSEQIVDLSSNWKSKNRVDKSLIKQQSSYERIFIPASSVERKKEDGCMNKLKIERANKLRHEDVKNRTNYNILTGI